MKDGFLNVASATVDVKVADTIYNTENVINAIKDAALKGVKLIVFPELCITAYTCGDLFFQKTLLDSAVGCLEMICNETKDLDIVSVIGLPLSQNNRLYNCAAVINRGQIKGIVPKTNISNYESAYFMRGQKKIKYVEINGQTVPFGTNILFKSKNFTGFVMGIEIGDDLFSAIPPSNNHSIAGATVIANLSANNELIGSSEYRELVIKAQSERLDAAYIYSNAGYGESTTDLVFSGDNIIAENGTILSRSERFKNECVYTQIDLERLVDERKKITTCDFELSENYATAEIDFDFEETKITRNINKYPFVPDENIKEKRCEEILTIQSFGLKKRIEHTNCKSAVIGISGGLDSTLALLVAVRAFDMSGLDRKGIVAITMPCFGTTDRTYNNAINFAKSLGVSLKEINIKNAVNVHFKDIEQPDDVYDVTFENSQARERTQVLMDIANKNGAMVIGTGDLSELALGWATYNGDHMSMYGVNAGVPKTLIRYLVEYEAKKTGNEILKTTLMDILDTPVSPELLPPENGVIAQKTEHIVGPYELHDFFLYYLVRFGFGPSKILRLAENAFLGEYDRDFILSWLKVFMRRFFTQQFKRSCLPDGPKVGTVSLSPRGGFVMPSDASVKIWMDELNSL